MRRTRAFVTPLFVVLAAALPLMAASCGQKVLLGNTEPPVDPSCVGAPCGTTCVIDLCPQDAGTMCAAPAMLGYCDPATDVCGTREPDCPVPPNPCEGAPCGRPCQPVCIDGDCPASNPSFVCDGFGSCVAGPIPCPCGEPACPPYDPCLGLSCGDACLPCDPMNPGCAFEPELTVCDGQGACVPLSQGITCDCSTCVIDCTGQPCGASCQTCGMMDPACPLPADLVCDGFGGCVPISGLVCPPPFSSCGGKVCGEPCFLCPPTDPMCIEPPDAKACDELGQCTPGAVACTGASVDGGVADGGMSGP